MLHTTFRIAREAGACPAGYKAMAKALGGIRAYGEDTPIPLSLVLSERGSVDTRWCLSNAVLPGEKSEVRRVLDAYLDAPWGDGDVDRNAALANALEAAQGGP